jgi:hypothetical protein
MPGREVYQELLLYIRSWLLTGKADYLDCLPGVIISKQ